MKTKNSVQIFVLCIEKEKANGQLIKVEDGAKISLMSVREKGHSTPTTRWFVVHQILFDTLFLILRRRGFESWSERNWYPLIG